MFLPFDFLGFLGRFIHSRSRSYYLFCTTCSLTTCRGGGFVRRKPVLCEGNRGGGGFVRKTAFRGGWFCARKTPPNHIILWINLAAAIA